MLIHDFRLYIQYINAYREKKTNNNCSSYYYKKNNFIEHQTPKFDSLELISATKSGRVLGSARCFFCVNSKSCDHVKSGYFLGSCLPKMLSGALTILSDFGFIKNARVFLSFSLLANTLWRQLLYTPLVKA